eukprot:jgi/Astpho2/9378/e_gw1.00145.152.1_t
MAEEGENPKIGIEEACKPQCIKPLLAYQACCKRIKGKEGAHCTGQFFDYWGCVDKCAAPRLFSVLK